MPTLFIVIWRPLKTHFLLFLASRGPVKNKNGMDVAFTHAIWTDLIVQIHLLDGDIYSIS